MLAGQAGVANADCQCSLRTFTRITIPIFDFKIQTLRLYEGATFLVKHADR